MHVSQHKSRAPLPSPAHTQLVRACITTPVAMLRKDVRPQVLDHLWHCCSRNGPDNNCRHCRQSCQQQMLSPVTASQQLLSPSPTKLSTTCDCSTKAAVAVAIGLQSSLQHVTLQKLLLPLPTKLSTTYVTALQQLLLPLPKKLSTTDAVASDCFTTNTVAIAYELSTIAVATDCLIRGLGH